MQKSMCARQFNTHRMETMLFEFNIHRCLPGLPGIPRPPLSAQLLSVTRELTHEPQCLPCRIAWIDKYVRVREIAESFTTTSCLNVE